MFVAAISIRREGYYTYGTPDPSKPFTATVEVHGQHNKTELRLSPEMSRRVVEIIAEEIAMAGREVADAMVASCINALPAPEKGK